MLKSFSFLKHSSVLVLMIFSLINLEALSQTDDFSAKNQFYFYWGYNRSAYTKSDLTCVGPGYNFTMNDLQASDNPERFNPKVYFDPKKITIPQFNCRIGYFFGDHWGVSLGYDHMKYVMNNKQTIRLTGHIDDTINTSWTGNYSDQEMLTNTKYIHYENSDGLNYMRIEVNRVDELLRKGKNDWFKLESQLGIASGFMLSFNDFNFAGLHTRKTVSISGYGLSIHPGMRALFFDHIFLQANLAAGFIHQTRVQTRPDNNQSFAFQKFGYISPEVVFGCKWRFKRKT